MQKSLTFKWIKLLSTEGNGAWRILPSYYLNKFGDNLLVFKMNTNFNRFRGMDGFYPTFYKLLLKDWLNTEKRNNSPNFNNNQVIWNNELITYKGNVIYIKRWINKNIKYFSDVMRDGTFISYADIVQILKDTPLTVFEYNIVKNALHNNRVACSSSSVDDEIYFNDKPLHKQPSKEIRQFYVDSKFDPINANSTKNWTEIYGENPFDSSTWKLPMTILNDVKIFITQWKILHQIYPTRKYLFKIKLSENNMCEYCPLTDTIEHYFFQCKKISAIWSEVERDLRVIAPLSLNITAKIAIFGLQNNDLVNPTNINKVNKLILIAKYCIMKYKVGNKSNIVILYENEKRIRNI